MSLSREIQRARNGGIDELDDLLEVVTRETISLDVIDVYLQRLHQDLCPPAATKGDKSQNPAVHAALVSIFSLPNLLSKASTRSELLDDVADAIVDTFDGIIAWINYLLFFGLSLPLDRTPGADFRLAYFANANVLLTILNFSPRCLDALYASPAAIDVVYKTWVTTGKKQQPFQRLNIPNRRCPIVLLMTTCWSTERGLRAFGKRAAAREQELPLAFISTMADRSQQVEEFLNAGGSINEALDHFSALCGLAAYIHDDIGLQQIAIDEELLQMMNGAAVALARKGDATVALRAIQHLLHVAILPRTAKRARNLQELLLAGWISTYLKIVKQKLSPDALDTAIAIAGELEVMCVTHPEIPDLLAEVLEHKSSPIVQKLRNHPQERFKDRWRDFLTAVNWTADVLTAIRGERRPFIDEGCDPFRSNRGSTIINSCDCPSCPFIFFSKSSNARKCQECKSVVYCSKLCQRRDWKAGHQKECRAAMFEYFRQSSEGFWYPHRIRAFHLDYIEGYCTLLREGDPSFFPKPALMIDFRKGTTRAARIHPGVYDLEMVHVVTPPHIESRFNALFGEMMQAMAGTLPDGKLVRFVEAIYPWVNGGLLSLLVKMKAPRPLPAKDMEFSVVYSVARIFNPL